MNRWLAPCLITMLCVAVPLAGAESDSKAEKARAAFAFMDRQEFMDGIEEAERCTARNDFGCADKALLRVKELIGNADEQQLWSDTDSALSSARYRLEAEREAERERYAAEQEAQRRQRELEEQEDEAYAREESGAAKFANVMNAFSTAIDSTRAQYEQQQAITRANNARITALQESARRQREAETAARQAEFRQREAERQQAYANQLAAAQQQVASQQAAREAAAAQRRADAAALQARQAAEREARLAQQEREARENAQRQMAGFVAATKEAEARNRPAPSMAANNEDDRPRSGGSSGSSVRNASSGGDSSGCVLKKGKAFGKSFTSEAEAAHRLERDAWGQCSPGGGHVLDNQQCKSEDESLAAMMGISHERATRMNKQIGAGESKASIAWTCTADYACTERMSCPARSSGASSQ